MHLDRLAPLLTSWHTLLAKDKEAWEEVLLLPPRISIYHRYRICNIIFYILSIYLRIFIVRIQQEFPQTGPHAKYYWSLTTLALGVQKKVKYAKKLVL